MHTVPGVWSSPFVMMPWPWPRSRPRVWPWLAVRFLMWMIWMCRRLMSRLRPWPWPPYILKNRTVVVSNLTIKQCCNCKVISDFLLITSNMKNVIIHVYLSDTHRIFKACLAIMHKCTFSWKNQVFINTKQSHEFQYVRQCLFYRIILKTRGRGQCI